MQGVFLCRPVGICCFLTKHSAGRREKNDRDNLADKMVIDLIEGALE